MSSKKRTPSRRQASPADWLGREHAGRSRLWALEEQLLGAAHTPDQSDALRTLSEQLSQEQLSLSRMETALHEEMRRVAELQRRLAETATGSENGSANVAEAWSEASPSTVSVRLSNRQVDRDYWLSRCEGFRVASPSGEVGVVGGLRFGSRLDCPDLLEIQVGRLRRRILVVPVAEVEHIWFDEERLELDRDPRRHPHREHVHALIVRLRGKPRVSPS